MRNSVQSDLKYINIINISETLYLFYSTGLDTLEYIDSTYKNFIIMYVNQHLLYGTTLKYLSVGEFFINSLTIFINGIRETMTSSTVIMYAIFGMFIFSEIMVFSTFIWGFFHFRLSNPVMIIEVNLEAFLQISDVLNAGSILISLILQRIEERGYFEVDYMLERLILIGFIFLSFQGDEYSLVKSYINNHWVTLYFNVLTGLHSLHVYVGGIFALMQAFASENCGCQKDEDFNAGMYWHFVEIIWIALTMLLFLL
ncbi:cytochrome C oxidase subunit III (COX3 homologue), putative (mitochondrion) [Theileria annulata]|uniref:Cytochrome c oxidase subunit 3 n=2 Tax=Theileria annulata TaxID=5874 RepID=COX3_THEAN|nr:cytochrome C oxidase subunit III (COX3 homologue), putative [Theileria annulata]Q37679.1 RecName: Full=Cytochrome c oxidase subunit 3; AltName: Full=Cytochrome c oxidase polypeptide III [Theileria annulata]AAA73631.1 cytochrome oxidase polypeptide III [Theileria annulata]CAI72675.1 cytochrome C oxidase subunit III (COX3 homologue), putative [Theileria annulata]|eukprot:XP_020517121.1 cytochrome C oxidase subunit III (COX3 homologue), putative (mitochondrion) [Theileria annulata]